MRLNWGDRVFVFSLWIWLTIIVGPWWVGIGILIVGTILNIWLKDKEL